METFRQWFEANRQIHFIWNGYGEVTVVIDGQRYVYDVDAFWFEKLKYMIRKAGPWKTFNYIKNNFKLLEPEPVQPAAPVAPVPVPRKQLRLFR